MITVNTHEAKTNLSRLLARVACGEEIAIAKAGKPIAKLVPIKPLAQKRIAGIDQGEASIAADFDAPLPDDLQAYFD